MTNYVWHRQYGKSFFCQLKNDEVHTRATLTVDYGKPVISIEFPKDHDLEQVKMTAAEIVRYLDGTLPAHRLKLRGYFVPEDEA